MYACEHTTTCRDQDPTMLQRAWVGVCQTPGTCLVTTVTPVPPHTDATSSPEPSGGLGHSSSHQPLPLRPDQVPAGEWGLPVSSHPQTVGARSPQTWPAAGLPCTSLCSGCRGPRPSSGQSACSLGWAFLLCGPGVCPPEEYGPREPPVSEKPSCPPGPGMLERSSRFSSQDGTQGGGSNGEALRLLLVWPHPQKAACPLPCACTEKGRPRAHACAPGMLSREQRHKATGSIRAHPPHADELEGSSNTNLDTGGLSHEEAQYSRSGKPQTFLSPPLTGWSFSSSQHHPSLFPSCPAPRTEGNHVPSLSAPHL